jgi:hypothetical protein
MSESEQTQPQSPLSMSAVVLPLAETSSVNINAVDRDARNKFHRDLDDMVEASLRQSADNMAAYDLAYTRSMKMLAANIDHETKPMLGQLTNVVYTYADPMSDFSTLITIDPVVAVWAGHLFTCCLHKVFFLRGGFGLVSRFDT